jgi:outer membrane lipopolysaccharide assembly protein LptE/RlpB
VKKLLVLCLALAGCGYHATGRGSLPTSIHSIAVPAFGSQTRTYKVEQLLTTAVASAAIPRTLTRC